MGTVVSDRMEATITVRVERTYRHPKYGKYIRTHKKYLAHDGEGLASTGDSVEIASTRPLSKRKRWRLLRVLDDASYSGPLTDAEGGVEAQVEASRAAELEARAQAEAEAAAQAPDAEESAP